MSAAPLPPPEHPRSGEAASRGPHGPGAGIDIRIALGAVAAVAFLVRILHVASLDTTPVGEMAVHVEMATERLTAGRLFRPEGLCLLAPGYALFLKPFFLVAPHDAALLLVRIVHALLGAWTCLLLYRLSARLHSRQAGLIAAVLACFYPHLVFYTCSWLSENLFIPAYVAALLLLLKARGRWPWPLYGAGLATGAASLVQPAALTLAPLALAAARRRDAWPRRARAAALVLCGLATVVFPWSVRNWIAYGFPVLISPGTSLRPAIANRPAAGVPQDLSTLPPGEVHGLSTRPLGEVLAGATNDPLGLAARLSKTRWNDFWELRPPWPLDTADPQLLRGDLFFPFVPWHAVLPMGLVGIGVLLAHRRRGAWLVPAAVATWVTCSLPFQASTRLRLPLEALFLAAAGVAVAEAASRLRSGRAPRERMLALIVSVGLIAVTGQAGCQAARVRSALSRADALIAREEQFPVLPVSDPRTLFKSDRIPLHRSRGRYLRLDLEVFRQGPDRPDPVNGALWIRYHDRRGEPLRWELQSAYRLDALPADRWVEVSLKSHIPPAASSCHVFLLADASSPDTVIVDHAALRYSDGNDLALEFLFPYLRRRE